jgi:hypothetical protein
MRGKFAKRTRSPRPALREAGCEIKAHVPAGIPPGAQRGQVLDARHLVARCALVLREFRPIEHTSPLRIDKQTFARPRCANETATL